MKVAAAGSVVQNVHSCADTSKGGQDPILGATNQKGKVKPSTSSTTNPNETGFNEPG